MSREDVCAWAPCGHGRNSHADGGDCLMDGAGGGQCPCRRYLPARAEASQG